MDTRYEEFITRKNKRVKARGFEPFTVNRKLFAWQQMVVKWAIRQGCAALFLDAGLGKTFQQLEWARQVHKKTKGPVLILAPLAVAPQTVMEGKKFGIKCTHIREQSEMVNGINIINYDRLDKIDAQAFAGVVLDESSILKSFTGKTRIALTEMFVATPYRLCCTATPAPNDYMELGQHAEFLGVCTTQQMLATWFINDTFDTGDWRLKGHSRELFWKWVSSWAACINLPSDIGFPDDGYVLPELKMRTKIVTVDHSKDPAEGELFRVPTMSATTMHKEMKLTCDSRALAVAEEVNASTEQWLVWCNTNVEADALKAAIPGCTEIRGSDTSDKKEAAIVGFLAGEIRVLVSKSSIFGYGMNLQCCHNVAFVGLSYSYEDLYQALRRSYRFGQTQPVNAIIVQAETEGAILQSIQRKMQQHEDMKKEMRFAASEFNNQQHQTHIMETITTHQGTSWTLHHGDCVRVAKTLKSDSIGFSVFSPPFADLFTYSNDEQDMGNCSDLDEFMEQFKFLVDELMRVTMPGRECAVHCCDLLATKWKDGAIEFKDFSGVIVKAFRDVGWQFHSRICIWKSPVTEMQRTKAHGLLYKTLQKDSANSRVGSADYLLVFRKPGENPVPIEHTPDEFPLNLWQEIASPVWMTIDQGNVLNGKEAKDSADERHICPLQLDVIDRALMLWSAPGDLVFSPFAGIGSEGYCAIKRNRQFVGAELKASYVKQAVKFLQGAEDDVKLNLFKVA